MFKDAETTTAEVKFKGCMEDCPTSCKYNNDWTYYDAVEDDSQKTDPKIQINCHTGEKYYNKLVYYKASFIKKIKMI